MNRVAKGNFLALLKIAAKLHESQISKKKFLIFFYRNYIIYTNIYIVYTTFRLYIRYFPCIMLKDENVAKNLTIWGEKIAENLKEGWFH